MGLDSKSAGNLALMRVGIDVRCLQFAGGRRGTGRLVHNLIRGLVALGSDAQYVLLYFKELPFPERLQQFCPPCEVAGIEGATQLEATYPWYQCHPRLRTMGPLVDAHWRSYYKNHAQAFADAVRREKLDLVHVTAPFDPNLPPASDCPVKTVYTFLDAIPLVFPDRYYRAWPVVVRRLYDLQKSAFVTATRVVAISDCSRDDAVRLYGINPERATRVYAALEPDVDRPVSPESISAVRSKFHLGHRYFSFCSMADFHKGNDSLIAALTLVRERSEYPFQLAFLGVQPPRVHVLVREQCFDAGLNGRDVVVTGFVSDDEMDALFKGSVALVSPSRYEGFGYPAAQAMAMGVPVIASDKSSLPEVVGDAGILIDPESPESIADAMLRLAGDETLCQELVARGRERAKMFDCEKLAHEMWEVYRTTLA